MKKELSGHTRLTNRKTEVKNHPATIGDIQVGQLYNIPIEIIQPNPQQPRQYFNEAALNELAASIRRNGIIQPLAVQKNGEGEIIILAGERRLRAAKSQKWTRCLRFLPKVIRQKSP